MTGLERIIVRHFNENPKKIAQEIEKNFKIEAIPKEAKVREILNSHFSNVKFCSINCTDNVIKRLKELDVL